MRQRRAEGVSMAQIERLLLSGHTIAQTAAALGLAKGTVLFYTTSIYRQNGVKCLKELLLKHGVEPRPRMRGAGRGRVHSPIGNAHAARPAAPTRIR